MERRPVTIAFDVMGSDLGPDAVVHGAARLTLESTPMHVVLVGDNAAIASSLERTQYAAEYLSVHHAEAFVQMDESPAKALAAKPNASIAVAARLVAAGQAEALVSAGNTGACVLASRDAFKLIPGVRRGALAAVYPTSAVRGSKQDPFSLILDVGATVEVTADDLVAFAVMGSAYSRIVSKNERPKVALLSNGTEAQKGPARVVEAHARLKSLPGIEFLGNVEGVDIPKGTADVVVCDGFVGNVALKMLEGVHETVLELAKYAYKEKLLWRAGLALLSSGFDRLKDVTDWQQYGGAPVLGFDRIVIKAHGRSNARAVTNAGKVAARAVASDLAGVIRAGLPQTLS